jgi:hypothetical protein
MMVLALIVATRHLGTISLLDSIRSDYESHGAVPEVGHGMQVQMIRTPGESEEVILVYVQACRLHLPRSIYLCCQIALI